jgi:hypothetical protein
MMQTKVAVAIILLNSTEKVGGQQSEFATMEPVMVLWAKANNRGVNWRIL